MNQLPLRKNVCMLVLNHQNKIFLGERINCPSDWQFPQGGVEGRDSLEKNVLRELEEELGADPKFFQIMTQLAATHEYDFNPIPDYARGKYRGQAQTFWVVRFLGADSDIHLDRYHPEFMNFQWVSFDEVQKIAEPKRREGYRKPIEELKKWLQVNSLL